MIISFIITGLFKYSASTSLPRSEGKNVSWTWPQAVFNRSPNLIINIWFPSPILSRRVCSAGGAIAFMLAMGNCSHLGGICLFKAPAIDSVGFGALLCCEGRVLVKHGHEKSACIMEGGFLSDKIRDNLIKLFDGFEWHCVFGFSLAGLLITGADDSGLAVFSRD